MIYWLSSEVMTVTVETEDTGRIITTPPAVKRFIGQSIENLKKWMGNQEGFQWEIIPYKDEYMDSSKTDREDSQSPAPQVEND